MITQAETALDKAHLNPVRFPPMSKIWRYFQNPIAAVFDGAHHHLVAVFVALGNGIRRQFDDHDLRYVLTSVQSELGVFGWGSVDNVSGWNG